MNKLYNPKYLKKLCQENKLSPSKKYGQNFLINPKPIEKMIQAADLTKQDTVVEIGPGFGVFTLALLKKVKKVLAFEIEKKLQNYWLDNKFNNLEIIWGNVLQQMKDIKLNNYKVVANLPYQITSNIIRKFLEHPYKPKMLVLMVQAEVAKRICAQPGQLSLLAVSVQYYAQAKIVMSVPKTYFWPCPQVNSAIIKIVPHDNFNTQVAKERFFPVVKAGFSKPRKTLMNNLGDLLGKAKQTKLVMILKKMNLSNKVRAQELSMDQWVELVSQI